MSRPVASVQEAAAQGCCMLFLPECFSFIGLNQDEVCRTHMCLLKHELEGQLLLSHTMRLDPGTLNEMACGLEWARLMAKAYACAALPGLALACACCCATSQAPLSLAPWNHRRACVPSAPRQHVSCASCALEIHQTAAATAITAGGHAAAAGSQRTQGSWHAEQGRSAAPGRSSHAAVLRPGQGAQPLALPGRLPGAASALHLLCINSTNTKGCKQHGCKPAYMPAGRMRHTASGGSVIVMGKVRSVFGLLGL